MNNALIGHSGFVGSTLLKQTAFTHLFRSTDIQNIENQSFDTVVCAGAPAQKWIANKDPAGDKEKIEKLISHLKTMQCKSFVLISTVDVFKNPLNANEQSPVDEVDLHPYGLHRRLLESFVESHFANYLIVRLPGLVGPGLRKNIIFDLLNNNNLSNIDSRGVFQFYPMVNLWYDIQTALQYKLRLIHLTAEPISVAEIAEYGFGINFSERLNSTPANYNFMTKHALEFGAAGPYQYNKREVIQAVRSYAQSEPMTMKDEGTL